MKEISVKDIKENVVKLISEDWALLTAKDGDSCNPMTVSWGGIGELWGMDTATVYVRESRYTKGLIDKETHFSLCFFKEESKAALKFCGSKSGRDVDKFDELSLEKIPAPNSNTYFVGGCEDYIECKIVAKTDLTHDMLDGVCDAFYKDNDMHTLYFGEIID